MSADSTEITFVRCPSCRSLVPAASTRCRMCGAKLDTAAAADEADGKDKGRRVRQRTSSDGQEDMMAAVEQIRHESDDRPVEKMVEPAPSPAPEKLEAEAEAPEETLEPPAGEGEEVEDPLGDYLDDLDEESDVMDDEEDFLTEDEDDFFEDDFDDIEDDLTDEADEQADVEPAPNAVPRESSVVPFSEQPKPSPVIETIPVRDAAPVASEKPKDEPPAPSPVAGPAPVSESQKKETQKPRVVIETGARGRGGLSFSRKKETSGKSDAAPEVKVERERPEEPELEKEKKISAPVVEEKAVPLEVSPVVGQSSAAEKKEEEVVSNKVTSVGGEEDMGTPSFIGRPVTGGRTQRQEGVKPEEGVKGRLVGWLVNYADADGTSVELREGRFFASRNSLKQSDLIIDDPSISTPHALIIVTSNGVTVQDLMSDRGVFHRGRDSDSYRKEIDPFHVGHGDWIRFGDVEFLVSLIAYVGVK